MISSLIHGPFYILPVLDPLKSVGHIANITSLYIIVWSAIAFCFPGMYICLRMLQLLLEV